MATYYDAINDGETALSAQLDSTEVTSFTVNNGSQLPVGGAGTSGFIVKLEDNVGNREYIICTHRSANTVYIDTRGAEGTVARTWSPGSYLKNVFTKGTKDNISDKIGDLTYTESNYIATDEPISDSVDKIDIELKDANDKIGDLLYTEDNYIVDSEPLTDSVDKIDMTLKDTNDTLSSHMAEDVSYATTATRDVSVAGSQIISGFPFVPKAIIINAVVASTNKSSRGQCTKDDQQVQGIRGDNGLWVATINNTIWILDSGANNTTGTVTINEDNTITINWAKNGTGGTGTATLHILALSH